jgi:hypothetical protein
MFACGWLQVPQQIFITDKLPKGATGKIQRRNMPGHFLGNDKGKGKGESKSSQGNAQRASTASGKPLFQSKL